MPSLRLLADDLTGALDTSAELVGQFGSLQVHWSAAAIMADRASFAIDSGTRELAPDRALAIVRDLAPRLAGATIAYKKIDSLLRGPWVAELDACLRSDAWDACILAPAFVQQGRRTINGQQYARAADGGWSAVGKKIIDQLRERKLEARLSNPSTELMAGISVFDAETEDDLDRIVELGKAYPGKVLWCGSGGLANALGRGTDVSVSHRLKGPVLGIFGTDHRSTLLQLAACDPVMIRSAGISRDIDRIKRALDQGVAFVKFEVPSAVSRDKVAERISSEIASLSRLIERPGSLIVTGGETLKAQAVTVEARALRVLGRLEPGIPKSVIEGGPWSDVEVVSKSGAFGTADVLRKLLQQNGLI
jgi:D-threonate/D-erythronate kinase